MGWVLVIINPKVPARPLHHYGGGLSGSKKWFSRGASGDFRDSGLSLPFQQPTRKPKYHYNPLPRGLGGLCVEKRTILDTPVRITELREMVRNGGGVRGRSRFGAFRGSPGGPPGTVGEVAGVGKGRLQSLRNGFREVFKGVFGVGKWGYRPWLALIQVVPKDNSSIHHVFAVMTTRSRDEKSCASLRDVLLHSPCSPSPVFSESSTTLWPSRKRGFPLYLWWL